jgi:hypothetical protein
VKTSRFRDAIKLYGNPFGNLQSVILSISAETIKAESKQIESRATTVIT